MKSRNKRLKIKKAANHLVKVFILTLAILLSLASINQEESKPVLADSQSDSNSFCNIDVILLKDTFVDTRDNQPYQIIKVDSLLWFNENLSFSSENSVKIRAGSQAKKGRLYSFSDSKIICPSGWRLPTLSEFDHLIEKAFKIDFHGITSVDLEWNTIANNHIGFNFDQTGFLHKRKYKSDESFNMWLDGLNEQNVYHVHLYDTNRRKRKRKSNLTVFRHAHSKHKPKNNRKFAIRCVCKASAYNFR